MKTLVRNYTFDASAKQIIFTGLSSILLEEVLLITNVTDNIIIYNFADSTSGGSVTGNILTLDYDTTSMSDTDDLQIFIDVDASEIDMKQLKLLIDIYRSTQFAKDGADRLRTIIDSSVTSIVYNRNSSSNLNSSTEGWYSSGSWSTIDAREQLKTISEQNMIAQMQKWRG